MKTIKLLSPLLLFVFTFTLHAQPPRQTGTKYGMPVPQGNAFGWHHNLPVQDDFTQAVDSNCLFRTQTQGGWGSAPHGNNPGAYLHANFDSAFPTGVVVGCDSGFTLTLTSAQAVTDYLPAGGRPAVLTTSLVDPTGYSNNLASQLVTLALTLGFDGYDANFGVASSNLADATIASGTFAGWTVQMVFEEANAVLGGCSSAYSASVMSGILGAINESFVDGNAYNGDLLVCEQDTATCIAPQLAFTFDDTICDGLPFHLVNQSQGVDSNATYYLDINSDGSVELTASASDLPDDTLIYIPLVGEFDFTVIVVNGDGCTDTLLETIEILPLDSCVANDFLEFVTLKNEMATGVGIQQSSSAALNAFPNPFSETVNIEFSLSSDARVRVEIVNLEGKVIGEIFEGNVKGGETQLHQFHAGALAYGMYFYRMITENGDIHNRKLILNR